MNSQRRVSFNTNDNVVNCDNLSRGERKSLWYSKREIAEIRAQVRRDIRDLKPKGGTKHIMDAEQDCFRGLEAYRSKERETKVRNFVRTIVDEHMTRRSMGLWDEIGIAMLSVTYSKQDRNLAHFTATSDAAEICTAGSKGNNEDVLKRGFSRQSSSAPSIVVYESELRRKINLKIYERDKVRAKSVIRIDSSILR